jgi:SNF2 family DNA or RNA helicase
MTTDTNNNHHILPDDLFPYQKEDVDRLLSTKEGFLNFSEMGTGKTPVALGLTKLGGYKKTLIVCPKTLRWEWARQIEDWMDLEPTVSRKGCMSRLDELADQYTGDAPDNPFFIVNYETFRNEMHRTLLKLIDFDLAILDEAHKLRNGDTKMFKGVKEFFDIHTDTRVLAMTGSPIVNRPDDLYSLLELARPNQFPHEMRLPFMDEFCYVYRRQGRKPKVLAVKNPARLQGVIKSFSIQRMKKEVLKFLPDKYYRVVQLEMEPKQREVYDKAKKELLIELDNGESLKSASILALLIRLRQLNLEPRILGLSDVPSVKTDFLNELIDELGDQKLVIFSTFESYIRTLERDFYHQGLLPGRDLITITGTTPSEDRAQLVKIFQENDNCKFALGTMQTMGEGLTLTTASNVILMDRWWAPTVNDQAVDRLHRIGQKNPVQVILPVIKNTIDSSLDAILKKKYSFIQDALGQPFPYEVMESVIGDLKDGLA